MDQIDYTIENGFMNGTECTADVGGGGKDVGKDGVRNGTACDLGREVGGDVFEENGIHGKGRFRDDSNGCWTRTETVHLIEGWRKNGVFTIGYGVLWMEGVFPRRGAAVDGLL